MLQTAVMLQTAFSADASTMPAYTGNLMTVPMTSCQFGARYTGMQTLHAALHCRALLI